MTCFALTSNFSPIFASRALTSASAAGLIGSQLRKHRVPAASSGDGSRFCVHAGVQGCVPFDPSR